MESGQISRKKMIYPSYSVLNPDETKIECPECKNKKESEEKTPLLIPIENIPDRMVCKKCNKNFSRELVRASDPSICNNTCDYFLFVKAL